MKEAHGRSVWNQEPGFICFMKPVGANAKGLKTQILDVKKLEGHSEEGHSEEGHSEEGHSEEGPSEEGHSEEGPPPPRPKVPLKSLDLETHRYQSPKQDLFHQDPRIII